MARFMFSILNRLRGAYGWVSKLNGIVLGYMFYLYSLDIYTSFLIAVGYIVGESFGWGKWIYGVYSQYKLPATQEMIDDKEGRSNGIHYLASLISKETTNYYRYCFYALTIRGIYWFSLTMLPMLIFDYISIIEYITMLAILGYGFPISIMIGAWTEKVLDEVGTDMYWKYSEVWYGVIQDICIVIMIVLLKG